MYYSFQRDLTNLGVFSISFSHYTVLQTCEECKIICFTANGYVILETHTLDFQKFPTLVFHSNKKVAAVTIHGQGRSNHSEEGR